MSKALNYLDQDGGLYELSEDIKNNFECGMKESVAISYSIQ